MKHILKFFIMWIGGSLVLALIITLLPFKISNMVLTYISILWLLICIVINFVLLFTSESE